MWTKLDKSCLQVVDRASRTFHQQLQHWNSTFAEQHFRPVCGTSVWTKSRSLFYRLDGGYVPLRSELTEASDTCKELIKYNCKKSCRGHCKCGKKGWHAPSCVLLLGNLWGQRLFAFLCQLLEVRNQ